MIREYLSVDYLAEKFSCHHQLETFFEVPVELRHLVTGFGPTNPPTADTISVIQRAVELEQLMNVEASIVISDVGTFNCRNIPISKCLELGARFEKFIRGLGFKGEIRSHRDPSFLIATGVASQFLSPADFEKCEEVTIELYQRLGLQGEEFSTLVDLTYTLTDIMLPILAHRKQRVLVIAGIEEHAFLQENLVS